MSGSQSQSQEVNMNMSDYLDFNFGDVLQAPSSPFNPFEEYDFPSPSQPHAQVSGPSGSGVDFKVNATASTSFPNNNTNHAAHSNSNSNSNSMSNSNSPLQGSHSSWTPPPLTYSLTSPEETHSNVSPTMTLVGGDAFSPVLVNEYLTEPEGAFGFSYPNRAYAEKGQIEGELDGYFKSAGSFTQNTGNDDVGTVTTTFDLPLSPQVKQEPMTDPQQFLPFDANTMGGTVNTADLFGSLPGPAAGAGMNVDMAAGMGMDMEKGFKGSFVFGNEDAGMGMGMEDYLGTLQRQIQLQQQLQFQQHHQQQQQHQLGNGLPTQHSEDEGDSVNAASPAAHSVASTSSRKPSTTGSATKASSAAAKASSTPAASKPAAKKSVGKKAAVAKQSRAVSVAASVRDHNDEDDDEDDEEDDSKSRRGSEDMDALPLPAMFGGVKGKGGKKGGGMSSVVLEDGEEAGEEDDWRPSAEEYKKMSSKEKRQLRNKLSARAFRNRRKTYINELEDHIKDRDRLIDAIRNELKNFRSENDELRREIGMMKKAALEPSEEMTPVRSNTASSSSTTKSRSTSASSPISTFNPRKDLPASTSALLNQMSPRSSLWGEGAGGYTSVHATFMPDLALPSTMQLNIPRQNLNPHLNGPVEPATKTPHPFKSDGNNLGDSFEAWSSETPFSYRSLEAYRMQLWSRMARDASLAKQGVPLDMRPKFLKEPTEIKAAVVAAAAQASTSDQAVPAPVLSNVISSAISTRLFSAFLSAFQSPTGRGLDGDRVAAVFTGKAGLKVVNHGPASPAASTEQPTASARSDTDADAALAASFAHLKVATESLGIKSPDSGATSKSLPSPDEEGRGWGFLSRSVVRG